MKSATRNYYSLPLLLFIVTPLLISGILISNLIYDEDQLDTESYTPIQLSAITNVSIQTSMPQLVWIEVQLKITIVSNITGTLSCNLANPGSELYFENKIVEQLINNDGFPLVLEIRTHPSFFTLPGKYNLELIITHIESTNQFTESFEIVLGLGYTILFSLLIVFGTAVLVVLTRKQELDKEKIISAQATQKVGKVPEGKMPCPNCLSVIDEGLAFCPECGDRIPEFLRFSPSSSS